MNNEDKHKLKMQKLKENIDTSISKANISKGIGVLLTGNGKGKTSSAFGMAIRALGYDYNVAIIQFIKGEQLSGEEIFIRKYFPKLTFHQMSTGFTWDTQDKTKDILAAKKTWDIAKNIVLDINTNGTILNERLLNIAKNFKQLKLHISLEGTGQLYQYIRGGDNFTIEQLEQNILEFNKLEKVNI